METEIERIRRQFKKNIGRLNPNIYFFKILGFYSVYPSMLIGIMDYNNIPEDTRYYVKKFFYNKLDEDERKIYLKGVHHTKRNVRKT